MIKPALGKSPVHVAVHSQSYIKSSLFMMLMRTAAILVGASILYADPAAPVSEAEKVALAFADAGNQMQARKMTSYLHPEFTGLVGSWVRRLAREPGSQSDRDELFKGIKVKSASELDPLSDAAITERFWEYTFGLMSKEARQASTSSRVRIIGSLQEAELMHVVVRYQTPVKGDILSAPSVITLKKDGVTWKVLTAPFLQSLRSQMQK